jgi:PqqD family protein of HPr-rel-A system
MRYRAEPHDGLVHVTLDSLTAVYHRRSGQTHIVAPPVPELLSVLDRGALDVPDLLAALGIDDDEEARALLTARLEELVETGLVAHA